MPDEPGNAPAKSPSRQAAQAARIAASRRGVGQLARLGYFAIGVVYAAMGALAMLGVLGAGPGQYTGSFGAMRVLIARPYGRTILFVLVAGVGVYASWRLAQSVFDVEGRGSHTGGLLRRGGLFLSASTYFLLALRVVAQMIIEISRGAQEQATSWTKPLMNHPAGLVLVGGAGLAMLGVAAVQFWSAYAAGFLEQIAATGRTRRSVASLGRFGFSARGIVFGIMAFFLIISALQATPGQAKGLGGAIQTLGRQPYGRFLIGIVAIGLFSYGLFMLAKARFRRLAPGRPDAAASAGEEPSAQRENR
jgi:hypothetical protein